MPSPALDILIIGAGPAGCTTALRLAQLGISSTIVDKAIFPRDKICGDAISGKVVSVIKKLNPEWVGELASSSALIGSYGVLFTSPSGHSLRLPFKGEFSPSEPAPGFVSKRIDFDNWLVEKVRKEPLIQLQEQTEIRHTAFESSHRKWKLLTKGGGELRTDFIIAADGAYSAFTKEVAGIETEAAHNCFGLRMYYRNVKGLDKENFIELHFINDLLPGYFWIFPLPNGQANVGAGIRADYQHSKKINLKKEVEKIIANHPAFRERFADAEVVDSVKLFGLPLGSKSRKLYGENYLLTGDAAMLIDPFTGEGIGNAMISGFEAAETLAEYVKSETKDISVLEKYQRAIERKLSAELKLSSRLQQLANYPRLFDFVVSRTANNRALRDTFSAMFYDVNIRAKLKNPLFYLELLFSSFKKK